MFEMGLRFAEQGINSQNAHQFLKPGFQCGGGNQEMKRTKKLWEHGF